MTPRECAMTIDRIMLAFAGTVVLPALLLAVLRELYGVGLASNTQVLDAVTLAVQATNDHANAVLDEALAALELAYAVGEL